MFHLVWIVLIAAAASSCQRAFRSARFTEDFEWKLSNGDLQKTWKSRPLLSHLRILGNQGLTLNRPPAVEIQSAFTLMSHVPRRPEDVDAGGVSRNKV